MWHSHVEGGVKRLQRYFIECLKQDKKPEPGIEDAARACGNNLGFNGFLKKSET
jgi:hypothetical protein